MATDPTDAKDSLEHLMALAIQGKDPEQAFFSALLEETVYVHRPAKDRSRNLRLVQFPHPATGALLLPFFSDIHQAREAGNAEVEVVAIQGRQLFQVTLGATLILNPNRRYCVLYPEEIQQLLDGKRLGPVATTDIQDEIPLDLEAMIPPAEWITLPLAETYAGIPGVEAATLAISKSRDENVPGQIVIVVVVADAEVERSVRATTVAIGDSCELHNATLDVLTVRPGETSPAGHLSPFYSRSASPKWPAGRSGVH
jgi:hypothetical protein